jgi:DnaA family protein
VPEPEQYPLAINPPHEQTLDNFVVGPNIELLSVLREPPAGFSGLWISARPGNGRSHLLRGRLRRVLDRHGEACYIGCLDFGDNASGLHAALETAARYGSVVAVDDVRRIAGDHRCEELLLGVYQRLLQEGGQLLVAHTHPALGLEFSLPDLNSRMRSLLQFQVQPLDDDAKARLLSLRARARGYQLSTAVLSYWLSRGPRELGALLTDLEVLDRASLVNQQAVTIPLLKRVLGY